MIMLVVLLTLLVGDPTEPNGDPWEPDVTGDPTDPHAERGDPDHPE